MICDAFSLNVGYYEGQIECFAPRPIATPTTGHPQPEVATSLHDQPEVTLRAVSHYRTLTLTESSLVVQLQATDIPSVMETAIPPTSVQAAARVTSTNRLTMLQTPTPTNGTQDKTGEQNEQESGSTSSAALSPVYVTLIAVSISILVVVSITLIVVCLLYRRRCRDKRKCKKPSVVHVPEGAQDSHPLEAPSKSGLNCESYN